MKNSILRFEMRMQLTEKARQIGLDRLWQVLVVVVVGAMHLLMMVGSVLTVLMVVVEAMVGLLQHGTHRLKVPTLGVAGLVDGMMDGLLDGMVKVVQPTMVIKWLLIRVKAAMDRAKVKPQDQRWSHNSKKR